jgi:hypothetical protein
MIIEIVAVAALAGGAYYAYKHYTAVQQAAIVAKVLANVKAEVAKIEAEVVSGALKAEVSAAIARIKSLL